MSFWEGIWGCVQAKGRVRMGQDEGDWEKEMKFV